LGNSDIARPADLDHRGWVPGVLKLPTRGAKLGPYFTVEAACQVLAVSGDTKAYSCVLPAARRNDESIAKEISSVRKEKDLGTSYLVDNMLQTRGAGSS
jgi:hypothetical protein